MDDNRGAACGGRVEPSLYLYMITCGTREKWMSDFLTALQGNVLSMHTGNVARATEPS